MSATLAGSYCSKLLSDGGAEVIKVEDLAGDPLRRWSASHQPIPAGTDGAPFSYLCGSKKSVVVDPASEPDLGRLERLLERADAVVWTSGSQAELFVTVGRTDWAADPQMQSVEGRRMHQDRIDEAIRNWCSASTTMNC